MKPLDTTQWDVTHFLDVTLITGGMFDLNKSSNSLTITFGYEAKARSNNAGILSRIKNLFETKSSVTIAGTLVQNKHSDPWKPDAAEAMFNVESIKGCNRIPPTTAEIFLKELGDILKTAQRQKPVEHLQPFTTRYGYSPR